MGDGEASSASSSPRENAAGQWEALKPQGGSQPAAVSQAPIDPWASSSSSATAPSSQPARNSTATPWQRTPSDPQNTSADPWPWPSENKEVTPLNDPWGEARPLTATEPLDSTIQPSSDPWGETRRPSLSKPPVSDPWSGLWRPLPESDAQPGAAAQPQPAAGSPTASPTASASP